MNGWDLVPIGALLMGLLGLLVNHLKGHPANDQIVTRDVHQGAVDHITDTLKRIETANTEDHKEIKAKLDRFNGVAPPRDGG